MSVADALGLTQTRERGLEGIVAKKKDSIYLPGKRLESWIKIKSRIR
jgi:bifunctional non-homologous end joining protein LigD